ncbi:MULTISPECIES: GNAT family N-acetyltransferase [Rubrivivax]|uniref:GNAT family N-acetyltransferase n=1 Tax=Rubrivivax benzoatilyticus TaxID=316997 RepID=A0ABX0HPC4_9BURK|nr:MULTISPECIES: GNAT family N-acetyltransferase [Rubrivivax]MCD0418518.1 GNAT family N-acetyltransferase [Rubrivivax sp. JA1024]EGJ11052.1 GNAT family acetyltransferase 24 [Rubrivivax benzoatilyticus JA2 = ATCC BAA-35]MCC9598513.1 GNAT family N-acetyltransferase [Rubrivivax sp. JA1055]NHK96938.1 GNAT family N-acetyltransferase [Rubrivivax benzoatilyticus]NHL24653.1 GNAT family N-acetyltransferase [Rubrivivax benzoatilyticus]
MPDRLPILATRAATERDLPWIAVLHHGPGAAQLEGEALASLRTQLAGAAVVLLDGQPVGLLRVHRGSRDWAIQQVQLLPAYRRAGIGSRLIAEVLAEARDQGARVSLSVLKSNPARSLYERLGFTVTAECENGYSMRAG